MNLAQRRLDRELVLDEGAPSPRRVGSWRRPRQRATALPETLEAVARALRSGVSLSVALDECGSECELDEVARASNRGLPLAAAVDRWAARPTLEGAPLAAAALALGAELGGAAAKSLDAVADTLRERVAVRREVQALSVQARASAMVIALAPLGFAFVVGAADPSNAAFLFTSVIGAACLTGGLVLNALGAWWIRRIVRRASSERDQVAGQLADVVDLCTLAVGAGLNLHLALRAVASRAPPAWSAALAATVESIDRGQLVGDALDALPVVLGDASRPLARALSSSERYGTPLLPALERLAADARLDRRRRAEEAARRVPVKLLFPLVLCVLPAFGLLTVAPLLAGALDALRL